MNTAERSSSPSAVLLCGGLGLRQRTDEDDVAKPLRPLGDGRALLLHVLDYYRAFGLDDFILCVGYGAAEIERMLRRELGLRPCWGSGGGELRSTDDRIAIRLVDSGVHAAKCERLLDARRHIGSDPFLLGYADVLSTLDLKVLMDKHADSGCAMTLAATTVRSRFGHLSVDDGMRVTGFTEKPELPGLVSAGYFMLSQRAFDWLSPDLDLESQVIPELARHGEVAAVEHRGLWLALDTYKDFVEAEALIGTKGPSWPGHA